MNIRKIFITMCGLLLTAQTTIAQEYMWMLDINGAMTVKPMSSVAYTTFNLDRSSFDVSITNNGIEGKTTSTVSASCTVSLSDGSDIKFHQFTPEVGVCYSASKTLLTTNHKCIVLGSEMKSYSFTLPALVAGTTYYYRIYVKLAGFVYYGDVVSVKTLGTKPTIINGHKFVDLGLPSGLLWAENNIGAETSTDNGYFFAWGETVIKLSYSWNSYKYGYSDSFIKYNDTDGKTVLDLEDEAAYVNWGPSCRMPIKENFEELLDSCNCIWTWTSKTNSSGSSINGYEVTSVKNGNSIFLPASGYRQDEELRGNGSIGCYWSSMLGDYGGSGFIFDNKEHFSCKRARFVGSSIRPVANLSIDSKFNITCEINTMNTSSVTGSCAVDFLDEGMDFSISEIGVCYSEADSLPTVGNRCLILGSGVKDYSFNISSLETGTTYCFRIYVKLDKKIIYGGVVRAKTKYKFIDLDLPSGLLWAETNIGAATAADDGDYFAWGETETRSNYNGYKYNSYNINNPYSKYNDTDGKTVLEKADDAAYVNWDSSCRMPTNDEFDELLNPDNCTWTWTSETNSSGNNINGYKVTSVKNGKSIFLPASGYREQDDGVDYGSYGYYWSSTRTGVYFAYSLFFGSDNLEMFFERRFLGLPIRPVSESKVE